MNPVGALDNAWFASKRRTRQVEDNELPAFYKAVDALPSRVGRDYIKLLLFTGFRRSEAAQLEWDHLDFEGRAIHIPENMTKTGEPLHLPMTDFVYDLLKARHELGREGKYVFPANGKHGHLQEPKFFLAQVTDATGIRVSPHDLRRGYITKAESLDISQYALKALVNHSVGGDDVTGGYIQMRVERLREPAQRVADRIKELCGIKKPVKAGAKRRANN
jgi:integrase